MKKKNGFTLAEVLITLMIIGIISAMTIPSIIQNTNKQELHAKLKKNYSTILNALNLAQVEEGMYGDNRALFTPSEKGTASYDTAKRFAEYLNTVKICKNKNDTGCSDVYYDVEYATERDDVWSSDNIPAVVLSDGSIYKIRQYTSCNVVSEDYLQDEEGNYILDEEGNKQGTTVQLLHCGQLYIDVNGAKKPNKFGEDNFALNIYEDRVLPSEWKPNGTSTQLYEILMNKKQGKTKKK